MTGSVPCQTRDLGEVVTLQRGFDLPAKHRRPGPFPVLTSGEGGGFHAEGPVPGPGVTIGRATNLGQPKWSNGDFWPHNTTLFVKDFHGNDPRWVFHLFESIDLSGYDSGSVQPMLNRNYVTKVQVRVPPINEQKAIAEVLGALDDKIAANTRLNDVTRSLAEAEWLRASMATSEIVRLRDVATLNYGKSLPAKRRVPGEVQVVGSGGVNGTHDQALVTDPGIVVGRKGTAGAVHWLHGPHFPIDTTYFVTPTGGLTSHFLYYELKTMRLTEMNSDSAVPGLNREEAYAAPVRHPQQESMRHFDEVVPLLFDSIAQKEAESEWLSATREAFLPLLMSGKVTVKDAESVIEGVV